MAEEIKKERFWLRAYDTSFIQDYHGIDHVGEYVSENAAIAAAMTMLKMTYQPSDQMEIQIYRKGLGRGEWVPIISVHYVGDDNWSYTEIVSEDIYS